MEQPRYHIDIFWSDEDEGYIANVPDLTYCSAFGETYQEALQEVLVSMELHLEVLEKKGRPIPEPKARPTRKVGQVAQHLTIAAHQRASRTGAPYMVFKSSPHEEVAANIGRHVLHTPASRRMRQPDRIAQ